MTKYNMSSFALLFVGMVAIAMISPDVMAAKIQICHKDSNGKLKTLKISENARSAHEGHGDFEGTCDNVLDTSERLMVKCDLAATVFTVAAASGSAGVSTNIDPTSLIGQDCAVVQAAVLVEGCQEMGVIGTPDSQVYTYACPEELIAIEPPPA